MEVKLWVKVRVVGTQIIPARRANHREKVVVTPRSESDSSGSPLFLFLFLALALELMLIV